MNTRSRLFCFSFLLLAVFTGTSDAKEPKQRHFQFNYGAALKDLPAGSSVQVWIPIAQSGVFQDIEITKKDVPKNSVIGVEKKYGNRMLSFQQTAEAETSIRFSITYRVHRKEALKDLLPAQLNEIDDIAPSHFLSANSKVPIAGQQLDLLRSLTFSGDQVSNARKLYDQVDNLVRYDKSKPGYGNGDVAWVCDSRTGNCTDFHSLFISWARAKKTPARFEIGFPIPTERGEGTIGGYHCWASFYTDSKGWMPVDISEADKHPELKDYYFGNLTENRMRFTIGRDITLVPPQKADPLNYFVYPYVEVDGTPLTKDKIQLSFSYKDLPNPE